MSDSASSGETSSGGEESSGPRLGPSPQVTRRALFGAAAAGVVAAGLGASGLGASPAQAATASAGSAAVTEVRARAVVVGSGFGGGVTALRLAQAGVPTLLLERGLRWPTGPNATTFPRITQGLDYRALWLPPAGAVPWAPYTGLLETLQGNGMTVNVGAAVGGGSLMYHGMTLQPSLVNFALSLPLMAGFYPELNQWAYPRVASMLGISTIPDDVLNSDPYRSSRLFLNTAPKAGLQTFRVPLPIDWSFVRGELNGQYAPTYTTSDIGFGVNNGGKHSIDVTYLAAAEATGKVQVQTLHVVRDIALDPKQRWVLSVDRIDTAGVVQEKKSIVADAVFLNAGSAGTTRLLVKAKAKGLVPNLPSGVGTQWGNNGDQIYAWTQMNDDPGARQGGPACVGGRPAVSAIPYTIIHSGSPIQTPGVREMLLVGFGIEQPTGTWAYDANKDDATLTWRSSGDAALQQLIANQMKAIAQAGGGQVTDTDSPAPSTWHPLGGVPMGTAVDLYGRVLGHRGLYVLDGSRIPGSTGACNPSMTIAALAEHSIATIVRQDLGPVF
ncbi:GMC oxidoreductase [Pseudofrankia sp. DC12]|uniref:GMC oxidoreductase n=1 Tax=Pseudofrankia sp. DC12 TaxID=683315 RepID=UPI0005F8432F|nr:GMC oxidoreductase [Pseudofrankia sp. DC12]